MERLYSQESNSMSHYGDLEGGLGDVDESDNAGLVNSFQCEYQV